MVAFFQPEIELNEHKQRELLEKYRLDSVMSDGHLALLWRQMQQAMSAGLWYILPEESIVIAAATLGPGIDRLQEAMEANKRLLDVYAVDCLAMEALQCLYQILAERVRLQGYYINKYIFAEIDTKDGYDTGTLLDMLGAEIALTDEGMMRPLKSVVFTGVLTNDADLACGNLCEQCSNTGCQYRRASYGTDANCRMSGLLKQKKLIEEREPGVLKYSYGYQRIFGRK